MPGVLPTVTGPASKRVYVGGIHFELTQVVYVSVYMSVYVPVSVYVSLCVIIQRSKQNKYKIGTYNECIFCIWPDQRYKFNS